MDSGKNILIRSIGRLLIVFPYLFHFSTFILFPSNYVSDFKVKYEWTRNILMDNGLKMLSPIQQVKGQEITAISLISFLMIMACLMFMLGDKRAIIIIMIVKCFEAYFFASACINVIIFHLGISIHLILKQYLASEENEQKERVEK